MSLKKHRGIGRHPHLQLVQGSGGLQMCSQPRAGWKGKGRPSTGSCFCFETRLSRLALGGTPLSASHSG